jgi:hypothetical protein
MGRAAVKARLIRQAVKAQVEQEALERFYKDIQLRSAPVAADDYLNRRILRVRAQLEKLDQMLAAEDNPQAIDRLASAQSRVSEQERILSGRPLPGSQRPRLAKPAKASGSSVEPE